MSDLIHTDDEARGLEYHYRGPVNMELPPARPAAYGVAVCIIAVCWFLTYLLSPAGWVTLLGVVAAVPVAIFTTRKVMKNVDYYRPLRYWSNVLGHEVETPRSERQAPVTETTLSPSIFKKGPRR